MSTRSPEELTMTPRFEDTVVLITGGGGGIGRSAARRFLQEGARVVLSGTRRHVLEAAQADLDPTGERTLIVPGHITGREDAQALVGAAVDRFGGVDVLVNSTGIFRPVPFLEQTEEHFEEALGSILRPTYWVSQAAAAAMIARGGGAIVQVGSCGPSTPSRPRRPAPTRPPRRAATRSPRTSPSSSPRIASGSTPWPSRSSRRRPTSGS